MKGCHGENAQPYTLMVPNTNGAMFPVSFVGQVNLACFHQPSFSFSRHKSATDSLLGPKQ